MTTGTRHLVLPLTLLLLLTGFQVPDRGLVLDAGRLPPVTRFSVADLDPGISACVDLNRYANSRWLDTTTIPADRSSWGPFELLTERSRAVRRQIAEQVAARPGTTGIEKIVGDFWTSGMDTARINALGLAPLHSRLAAIDSLRDGPAVAEYLRRSAARGENDLFGFVAMPDFKNSAVNIAYATPGGLGLPDRSYYFEADKREVLDAYRAHVARVLELSGVPAAQAEADDIVVFETALARVTRSSEEVARDVALNYNPVTLAEADRLTPAFSWTTFFEAQRVAAPAYFSLVNPAFFQEVSRALGDTDPATWQAYLRYHLIDDAAPYLSEPFVREDYDFWGKTLGGQREIAPRWERVLDAIETGAGDAMGQLYVQASFPPESKTRMIELVGRLRAALRARIERVSWMSDATREKALAKWAAFTAKIGYPDQWEDWSGLSTTRESYLGNVLAAQEFNYRRDLSEIGRPVDRSAWAMTPQTVNAYYNPLRNEIVFPAAILQPPFFDPTADIAFNYGGIGAVIGHEMTHGYDEEGSQFGPTGNYENWWTPADRLRFQQHAAKLIEQFDQYQVAPGEHVNGKLTLDENIADLGGLSTAYDALQAATAGAPDPRVGRQSRDQNFFLNWATIWRAKVTPELQKMLLTSDPHAPARFRAIGPPSNLAAYEAAFGCKPGEPMVRSGAERVVIW